MTGRGRAEGSFVAYIRTESSSNTIVAGPFYLQVRDQMPLKAKPVCGRFCRHGSKSLRASVGLRCIRMIFEEDAPPGKITPPYPLINIFILIEECTRTQNIG